MINKLTSMVIKKAHLAKKLKESGKKLKDLEKKPQGYEALSGLVGLKKVYKKQVCTRCSGFTWSDDTSCGKSVH